MLKDLKNNTCYKFEDLPDGTKADFLDQLGEEFEDKEFLFYFRLTTIPLQVLLEQYDELLGPNLSDYLEDDYVINLANDIKQNGLKNPPIGMEGNHRSLAFIVLEKDMPYFEIIKKKNRKVY